MLQNEGWILCGQVLCLCISQLVKKTDKPLVTVPPSDGCREYKYLQEGVHLLLDPVDKPPLDDQAVGGKINAESLKAGLMM